MYGIYTVSYLRLLETTICVNSTHKNLYYVYMYVKQLICKTKMCFIAQQ